VIGERPAAKEMRGRSAHRNSQYSQNPVAIARRRAVEATSTAL
jgi:hypothetical protein